MKDEFKPLQLKKNDTAHRFEIVVENQTAFIAFKELNQKIYLIHTEVPSALENRGIASAIIEKTLNYIEQHQYKLIALCPAVVAFIRRHPEWKRILDLEQTDVV